MNRMLVCLINLVLLFGCFGNLVAQENKTTYVVQPGDNLWNLAGVKLEDSLKWEQIYKDNPFLQEKGRRFHKNSMTYVMVRPGDKLVGLEKLGVKAMPVSNPLPLAEQNSTSWKWWWLLSLLALVAACVAYVIYRMLKRDPVNSGPAMVQGGVTDETATIAMQQVAARNYSRVSVDSSKNPSSYRYFQILSQVAGRVWGVLDVSYADGSTVPRRLNGERAYRAEVRMPNGHTETLYMLQGCGNDLRYGGISRYLPGPDFRFLEDDVVGSQSGETEVQTDDTQPVPTVVTEPVATGVSEVPVPVVNQSGEFVRTTDAPTVSQPVRNVVIEFKRSGNGQPNMIRLLGIEVEGFTFTSGSEGTTIRYNEERKESVVK